jgi:inner membrane protein
MDNVTHSLVGALIGQMGLKRKTGLAMPTLIIAANLPDIDAVAVLLGGHQHLAIRRGITHGPIAMLLLPLLLWGVMLWFDRWQTQRGKRPDKRLPVHKGWLLALAYIGCFSHALFDWFNSYGIRLLEPFSSQWFHGDMIFIIDIWLLAALLFGVWLSLRRERRASPVWVKPAQIAASVIAVYIGFNAALTWIVENTAKGDAPYPVMAVANEVPVAFWRRDLLIRTSDYQYDSVQCTLLSCDRRPLELKPTNMSDSRIRLWAKDNPDAKAFLFWSRMPIAELHKDHIILRDQRFMDPLVMDRFAVTLRPPE